MEWRVEHLFDAPIAVVESIALDPETVALVPKYMPAIAWARALERSEENGVVIRATRYAPTMGPPAFAKGFSRAMTEWVERSQWDLRTHVCRYEIEPNVPPEWRRYFEGRGVYRLEARESGRTARVVDGVLSIHVPLVGAIAERFVVKNMRGQFDGEATLIREQLAARYQRNG